MFSVWRTGGKGFAQRWRQMRRFDCMIVYQSVVPENKSGAPLFSQKLTRLHMARQVLVSRRQTCWFNGSLHRLSLLMLFRNNHPQNSLRAMRIKFGFGMIFCMMKSQSGGGVACCIIIPRALKYGCTGILLGARLFVKQLEWFTLNINSVFHFTCLKSEVLLNCRNLTTHPAFHITEYCTGEYRSRAGLVMNSSSSGSPLRTTSQGSCPGRGHDASDILTVSCQLKMSQSPHFYLFIYFYFFSWRGMRLGNNIWFAIFTCCSRKTLKLQV